MSFDIVVTDNFKKEAKRLLKKYASLKSELVELHALLEQDPRFGISLGNDIFKIRLAVASKNKGKSGGVRIIYLVRVINGKIYLFSIFDKSEKDNISAEDIAKILKNENLI